MNTMLDLRERVKEHRVYDEMRKIEEEEAKLYELSSKLLLKEAKSGRKK